MQSLWGQGKWETLWSSLMRRVQGILQEVHQKAGRYVSNLVISQESFKLSNVTHSNSMPNSISHIMQELGLCLQREWQLHCGCDQEEPMSVMQVQKVPPSQHEKRR